MGDGRIGAGATSPMDVGSRSLGVSCRCGSLKITSNSWKSILKREGKYVTDARFLKTFGAAYPSPGGGLRSFTTVLPSHILCLLPCIYMWWRGGGADIESYNVFHCVFLLFNSVYMCMLLTCTNGAVMHICTDVNKTILLCHSLPWHREVIARIFRNSLQLIYHIVRTHSEVLRQSQYVPHLALHECLEFCRRP